MDRDQIRFKATGKLIFDPNNKTKKHKRQATWKRNAFIDLNCDLCEYYSWFLLKRFNLKLNKPLRGSHITIIADRIETKDLMQSYEEVKAKYHKKDIQFEYDISPWTNGEHWWLSVHCPEAEDIREEAKLPRQPYFSFHLTIGVATHLMLQHSRYINNLIEKNLI